MADNSAQNATDTIRDKDRAGVKTQIFGLDLGIGGGTEILSAGYIPIGGAAFTGSSTAIAVATPANTAALDVSKAGSATIIIKNTTAGSAWAGAPVLVFEQSDDSTSWAAMSVLRSDTNTIASTVTLGAGAANAEIMFDVGVEGVNWIRVRCTTAPTTNGLTIVIQIGGNPVSPFVGATPTKGSKGAPTAVSVLATATLLMAANTRRGVLTIYNNGTSAIFLGTAAVTTVNGMPLAAGAYYVDGDSTDAWYAISATAGQDVRLFEVS